MYSGKDRCLEACRDVDGCLGFVWDRPYCHFSCDRTIADGTAGLVVCDQAGIRSSTECHVKTNGKDLYLNTAIDQLHYVFGRNPQDQTYVTGGGVRRLRSSVDQESLFDDIVEPVSGLPVAAVNTGAWWIQRYGRKAGVHTVPSANPFETGSVFSMLDQAYDGWNVQQEFTIDNLIAMTVLLAVVAPTQPPAMQSLPYRSKEAQVEIKSKVHPMVAIRVTEDRTIGRAGGILSVLQIGGGGIHAVRWFATARGVPQPISFKTAASLVQDYSRPAYLLTVEVEDVAGLRGYASHRLNTRDYSNKAIPLKPLQPGENTVSLFHLDGSYTSDGSGGSHRLHPQGNIQFGRTNLDWMETASGQALRVGGKDSQVSYVLAGNMFDRTDVTKVRLAALVYVESFAERGSWYTDVLSIRKSWSKMLRLRFGRWNLQPYVEMGTTRYTTTVDQGVFNLHQWHWIELVANRTHLSFCVDGICRHTASNLGEWLHGPEGVRISAGNFKGWLDEVVLEVERAPSGPSNDVSETCAGSSPYSWTKYRGDIAGLTRTTAGMSPPVAVCSLPKYQSALLVNGTQRDDEEASLVLEATFISGLEGSAVMKTTTTTDWSGVSNFGAQIHYYRNDAGAIGNDVVQIRTNNFGYGPQLIEKSFNFPAASIVTSAPTVVRAKLDMCGGIVTGSVWVNGRWIVMSGPTFNSRFSQAPSNYAIVMSGSVGSINAYKGVQCFAERASQVSRPVASSSWSEMCNDRTSLDTHWQKRFFRINPLTVVNGSCKIIQHQFLTFRRHLYAGEKPLVVEVSVDMAASVVGSSFQLYQDRPKDGFDLVDGVGVAVSVDATEVEIRTNNLGYQPQTVINTLSLASNSSSTIVVVVLCKTRTTAIVRGAPLSTTQIGNDLILDPKAVATARTEAFHSTLNWRFDESAPWMFRLGAGSVRSVRMMHAHEATRMLCT